MPFTGLSAWAGTNSFPSCWAATALTPNAARAGHYRELLDDVVSFPAAADLLRQLHAGGVAVVLATSSPSDELTEVLGRLDADDAIDAVTTADDVEESKPGPDVFFAAMKSAAIDPARALAVGDSVWDVRGARAAGVGCVGVETGGFSRHELSEAGALHVYRDVKELLDQICGPAPFPSCSGEWYGHACRSMAARYRLGVGPGGVMSSVRPARFRWPSRTRPRRPGRPRL